VKNIKISLWFLAIIIEAVSKIKGMRKNQGFFCSASSFCKLSRSFLFGMVMLLIAVVDDDVEALLISSFPMIFIVRLDHRHL